MEREVFAAPRPADFRLRGRVALRAEGRTLALDQLADRLPRTRPDAHAPVIRADSRADAVVVGKLASADVLKARAYLVVDGRPLTIKLWRSGSHARLGTQERTIRGALRDLPDFPAPPMLHDGRIGRTDGTTIDYVVEPLVWGRHPLAVEARVEAALELLPALARSWVAGGPVDESISQYLDVRALRRLWRVLGDPASGWAPAWTARARLYGRVQWLVRRDRMLPCVPAHGDMVTTNIIREPTGRHVLVDWEHGRRMPLAFDVAKLLLTSGRPMDVNRRLAGVLEPFGAGRHRYRWNEQVALGLCRMLTWSSDRRDRARDAGRLEQFDRERAAQIALLVELLDER